MEHPPTPPAPAPSPFGAYPSSGEFPAVDAAAGEPSSASPGPDAPPALLYVVGVNEGHLGGQGWHARTRDGRCGVAMRPLEPEAFWRLDPLPAWRRASSRLRLGALLCAAPSLVEQPVDVFLWAACDVPGDPASSAAERTWRSVGEWRLETDIWSWRETVIDLADVGGRRWAEQRDARLLLRLDTTPEFVPARHLGNRDYRSMGVNWGGLRVVEAGADAAIASEAP